MFFSFIILHIPYFKDILYCDSLLAVLILANNVYFFNKFF